MAETNTGVARTPIASVAKSSDPNWVRWAVSARKHQTEWFKSEAQAIKKADALCRAAGSITWTEYVAARTLHKRQVEALPELLEAALNAVPFVGESASRNDDPKARRAFIALEGALQKAGVEL